MSGLPNGWSETPIADVLDLQEGRPLQQGWSPQCERDPRSTEGDWAALRTTAIQNGEYLPEHNKRLPDALTPRAALEVRAGDVLIAISSAGRSPNIVRALEWAGAIGLGSLAVSGFDGVHVL